MEGIHGICQLLAYIIYYNNNHCRIHDNQWEPMGNNYHIMYMLPQIEYNAGRQLKAAVYQLL